MAFGAIKRFNWLPMRSAWKEMEYQRARRSEFNKNEQAVIDNINAAMADALQKRISAAATLAGEAALKRVQNAAKAKSDETIKQIDQAQNLIAQPEQSAVSAPLDVAV